MLSPINLKAKFEVGLSYPAYVGTGKPNEQANWARFGEKVKLNEEQSRLIGGFTRRIHAICISGTWCGDCVQQVPFFDAIARANPEYIQLRLLDRDIHADLSDRLMICGGRRVPILLLLNEDFDLLALLGDRSLNRYRSLAAKQLAGSCPIPGAPVPADELDSSLQDWVEEFERAHLMLRLSTKMRQRYGD